MNVGRGERKLQGQGHDQDLGGAAKEGNGDAKWEAIEPDTGAIWGAGIGRGKGRRMEVRLNRLDGGNERGSDSGNFSDSGGSGRGASDHHDRYV